MERAIILYSTNCPKCKVIETKLNQNNFVYDTVTDVGTMKELGITSAPQLAVNGVLYNFNEAIKWLKEQEVAKA